MSIYNRLSGKKEDEDKDKILTPSQKSSEQQKQKQNSIYSRLTTKTEPTVVEEEQKPSFIQKVKTGITKISEALSGKKKIEQQVQQTQQQTQQDQTLLQKVSTAQINQQKLKQNILDDQINRMKSFDSVTSADLTPGAKKKVEEITQPIFTEVERLGEKAKSTETKDWRDRVYESVATGKDIPFAGDLNQIPETVQLLQASTRLREGNATQEDAKLLKDWLDQQNRDSTFGYKVTDTLLQSLKFGAELYATAGAYSFGKESAKQGIKYLMGKAGKEATEELLQKFGYKVAAGLVGETVRTAVQAPIKITQSTLEKQIASNLEVVSGVTDSKESVGQSLIKSFSEAWVENVSERAGDAIGLGVKELSEPLKQKLVKTAIFNTLNKAIPNNTNAITKYLAKSGYDGILNEMLEERVGDAMNGLLYEVGMSDQEFQLPTKEQLLVELVSFSVPGVVSKTSEVITTRLDKIDSNTIKMTPDAARDTVNLSNLSGTPAGDEILKAADVAEKDEKIVLVDLKGNTGNKTETTEKNIIGVSVSEEKVVQQKEPQVTQEKDMTSPEALQQKKEELMKKVSVGKQGETIKTEETTKTLTNEEITQLKELAKASNTAKSFLDKIGPVNAEKIKSSGDTIIGFYNNANQPIKTGGEVSQISPESVSKVEGKPLTLYHGTNKEFKDIDITKAGTNQSSDWGYGFYLTPKKTQANRYASDAVQNSGGKPIVKQFSIKPEAKIKEIYLGSGQQTNQNLGTQLIIEGYDGAKIYSGGKGDKDTFLNEILIVNPKSLNDKGAISVSPTKLNYTPITNDSLNPSISSKNIQINQSNKLSHNPIIPQDTNNLTYGGQPSNVPYNLSPESKGTIKLKDNDLVKTFDETIKTEKKEVAEVKKVLSKAKTKKTTSEKVNTAKNITQIKSALKSVKNKIDNILSDVEGRATVAQELRSGLNTKDIAALKLAWSRNQKFQEGDLETIKNSNYFELVNRVVEDVQIKYPEKSDDEAYEFALNLPTKAEEKGIKPEELKQLIKRQKTLSSYLDTLKRKQTQITGEEEIKRGDEIYKEWTSVLESQEKLNKLITSQQRIEAAQRPVEEGTGKPKLSKVAQRVLDKLVDVKDYDVTYQPMNIVEDAAKAAEFVDQNPELSLKIAKGLELPPPDITETAISIAAAQKALDNKDYLLYTRLILSRTFRQTRRGQEIVAERGRQDENSTEFFMKKLLEERARLVTKGKTWLFEKEKSVQKIIAKEVQKVKTDMDKKVLRKLESAQKLIDSLTCKI